MDNKLVNAMVEALQKLHEENQKRPDQYVVVYKRKSDESIIGYHLSTFCQITDDILRAKRYSGTSPDGQLATIWKNFSNMMNKTEEDANKDGLIGLFGKLAYETKQSQWKDINRDDVYIDAVYLAEGTEQQPLTIIVAKGNDDSAIIK